MTLPISTTVLLVMGAVLLGLAAIHLVRTRNPRPGAAVGDGYECTTVQELTLEEVITWFKHPENAALLRAGRKAVLIRSESTNEDLRDLLRSYSRTAQHNNGPAFLQAVFDDEDNVIIAARQLSAATVETDLLELFGNRDMIVFN